MKIVLPFFTSNLVRRGLLVTMILLSVALAMTNVVPLQLLWLSLLMCGVAALLALDNPRVMDQLPHTIQQQLRLAAHPELSDVLNAMASHLISISVSRDPVFRKLSLQQLNQLTRKTSVLADGVIEFESTEAWRVTYEELLRSPGLYSYRSVSHVESIHYWQDGPGQQSTRLNMELQESGQLLIERIAVIAPVLWCAEKDSPDESILEWLDRQRRSGIRVWLVREAELHDEPELICDFGIYGSRAVGVQQSDAAGRTSRFALKFGYDEVFKAESLWECLQLHAQEFASADFN